MRQHPRHIALVTALCANAVLLLAILIVLLGRSGVSIGSAAFAAPAVPPIAGGEGVYVMPAQFLSNKWGCLVMDTKSQTLCAYEFEQGEKKLLLVGARSIRNDLSLGDFNTFPHPQEVEQWLNAAGSKKTGPPGRAVQPADEQH